MTLRRLAIVVAVLGAVTSRAAAQSASMSLNGYVRSLTGFQDLGYDPVITDRRAAFNGEVIRLRWLAELGDVVRISLHNRLQGRWTSADAGQGVLGFGVSAVPSRSIDLVTSLVDEEHVQVRHDLDRLAVTVYTSAADVTVGRQAITWGIANLFPVADLWAQFSPFELDTEEKPGTDALRVLAYPGSGLEVDLIVADRGSRRDVSFGGRVTWELPVADVYVAGGKFWREAMAMGGVSFVTGSWKLRAEAVAPWDLDRGARQRLRFTAGIDWIGPDIQASVEYHHNGIGVTDASDYVGVLTSPQLARGESYYVGRHYVGGFVARQFTDRVSGSLVILTNLIDPSAAVFPVVSYDHGQQLRLSAGGLISLGEKPVFAAVTPVLRSEFGTYGTFGYGQVALYF